MGRKEQVRIAVAALRNERRIYARKKLGDRCAACGATETLEFDHINPETKLDQIANLWTAKIERLDEELTKCQLLCKGCHLAKSRKNREMSREYPARLHGTNTSYVNGGCRCQLCCTAYSSYKRDYRQRGYVAAAGW